MAILLSPADPPRLGFNLNKRLLRITIAVLAFMITAVLLLAREDRVILPFQRDHESPEAYSFPSTSRFSPVSVDPKGKSQEDLCASFPKYMLQHVQPVLKIGHSENATRLEAQFKSVSSCFDRDELLVVSDIDEEIHGHRAIDVLADLPPSYYDLKKNRDFRNYLWQKDTVDNVTSRTKPPKQFDGWIIDKYKFLPMVERAWQEKPGKAFYFFYEADTYIFWDNAFRFLQNFNPDTPIYMGSPSPGRHDEHRDAKSWFANGGPGLVLSRGAIKLLLHRENDENGQYTTPHIAERYMKLLADECCGDSVLGWALWNASVQLQGYWPMFNPHPLHEIPFNDRHWCQPVISLHKTDPEDMLSMWKWEFSQRQLHRPLLYSDVWQVKHPGDISVREDWDNGDFDSWSPPGEAPVDSFEKCEQYCRKENSCVQWKWHGGDERKCTLMRTIRHGRRRTPEYLAKKPGGSPVAIPLEEMDKKPGGRWTDYKSGWVENRIKKWREERNCDRIQWVGPSITRIF